MTQAALRPIFATPHPLLIAGVREVLAAAGLSADPQIVAPEALSTALADTDRALVILDGQALPNRNALALLCRSKPQCYFILWVVRPTAETLSTALECGVHGLLSTRLPLDEASQALLRICRGERVFRFDSSPGPIAQARAVDLTPRERHLLLVLSDGASNAAIAAALHTTESNVKVRLSRMFRKTGTRNRRELMEFGRSAAISAESGSSIDPSFDAHWMLENP